MPHIIRRLLHQQASPISSYLVLGAYGGIGTELCRVLANSGANLFLAGRDKQQLQSLADEISGKASQVRYSVVDARKFAEVDSCVAEAVEAFGRLDGAANMSGSVILKPAHLTSEDELNAAVATNLTTAFALVRACAPRMGKAGGGSLVLMSSAVAEYGAPNHEAIASAKAGVIGLALSAAATYAKQNVRVNCVAPGLTRTPLTARITSSESGLKASEALHPLGRIALPGEVAAAAAFFLRPENSFITGQVLAVDGGLSTLKPR